MSMPAGRRLFRRHSHAQRKTWGIIGELASGRYRKEQKLAEKKAAEERKKQEGETPADDLNS